MRPKVYVRGTQFQNQRNIGGMTADAGGNRLRKKEVLSSVSMQGRQSQEKGGKGKIHSKLGEKRGEKRPLANERRKRGQT